MSEHWPPDWDDQDDEDLDGDDLNGENLAEVTAALASMPLPALPEAFQARISAAIRAEAATRAALNGALDGSATVRSSFPDGSSPAVTDSGTATAPAAHPRRAAGRRGARAGTSRAAEPAGSRPPGRERNGRRGFRALQAIGSLAVCLVLAGFGFLVFGRGAGPTYSSAAAAPAASAPASAFHLSSGSARSGAAGAKERNGISPDSRFLVRETGTRYEPATLAGQARAAVAAAGGGSLPGAGPTASAVPSYATSSGSPSTGGLLPSAALAGCVSHLTGNQAPSLVDRASYAGRPAYVIVVPRRAWVVGLGCTAARLELITSVALAGLSGNLRALGSVERRAILRKGACSDRRT